MRARLLALLAALLLAAPAGAVDRYTVPSGGSGSGQCGIGSPCTLARANAVVAAGDVVRMRAGNYGTADINPSVSGTAGSRIIYRPDTLGNPVNVDQIILASGRSNISVWNINATNALAVNAAQGTTRTGDSLLNVTANKPVALHDFTNSVFYNCQFGDTTTTLAGSSHIDGDDWNNVTLRRSRLFIHSNSASTVRPFYPGNWQSCTIDSNQWYFKLNTGTEQGSMFRQSTFNNFKDNHFQVWDQSSVTSGIGLGFRDNTISNFAFVRDTFSDLSLTRGGGRVTFQRGSGTASPANNFSWTNCVIRQGLPVMPANNTSGWTFTGCQIAVSNRGGSNPNMFTPLAGTLTNLTLSHCTLLYYIGDNSGSPHQSIFANEVDLNTTSMSDCVVLRMQSTSNTACPARSVSNTSSASANWNRNVYYLYNKFGAFDSTQSINIGTTCSATGSGTTACVTWGNDCNSRWGGANATFVISDTTLNPQFNKPDMTPSSTGLIVHTMWPDGYVGAINTGGGPPPPDTTPPDTISVLATQTSNSSILLTWTDAGDDGNTGTATTYDIRWSPSQITTANFASANVLATGLTPQAATTVRTYTHSGLSPNTTYWYAVSVYDDASPTPNWSGFNTVSGDSSTTPALPPRVPGTYYVTTGGADGNDGSSFKTGSAKSLNWAITQAIPGDVFIFGKGPEASAVFGSYLRPTVSGDSLNRIIYRGINPASRDTVTFPGLSTDGAANEGLDYTTFRWLSTLTEWDLIGNATGATSNYWTWRDSIASCRNRGFTWLGGAARMVISDCDSIGDRQGLITGSNTPDFWNLLSPQDDPGHNQSMDTKFVNINYYGGARGNQTPDRRFIQWHDALRCTLQNVTADCKFDSTFNATGADVAGHGMFWVAVKDSRVIDCSFTFENDSHNTDSNVTNDWVYAFLMRGGCQNNEFVRSTWKSNKDSKNNNITVSIGQTNLVELGNKFDRCKFEVDGQITFGYKDGDPGNYLDGNIFTHCQFAARGLQQNGTDSTTAGAVAPFRFDGAGTPGVSGQTINTTFRHCTFYSPRGTTPFHPRKDDSLAPDTLWLAWPSTTLKQCIIAGRPNSAGSDDLAQIDFSTVNPASSDTNLYVQLGTNQDSTKIASRSSTTQVMSIGGICTSEAHDCNSRASYHKTFKDTVWTTLDLTPVAASAADFGPDGYVGALAEEAAASSCVLDDFERAALGNMWVKRVGTGLTIAGSTDMAPGAANDQVGVYNRDPGHLTFTNDQSAEVGGIVMAGDFVGVMARMDTTGTLDGYVFGGDGGYVELGIYTAGSYTTIADGGTAPTSGDSLYIECKGDSIICWVGLRRAIGVTYTAGDKKTSGWPGVHFGGAGTDERIAYFRACDLTGGGPPADATAPDTTTVNATALDYQNILLTWTDQGDDANTGLADSIEIRVSNSQITSGNYGSATVVLHALTPNAPGTVRTFVYGPGIPSASTRWFAIKYGDEVPNFAAFGNSDSANTPAAPDTIPPDSVSIFARLAFPNGVKLSWTSPGDDGNTGTANNYDVRYSTEFITQGNFLTETEAVGEPAPAVFNTPQSFTFFGLAKNTTYYFALTTLDEVGNRSLVSNTVSVTTADTVASTAPYGATQAWTWDFPRFWLYALSSAAPWHRAYPFVEQTDPSATVLTKNLAMADTLSRFRMYAGNPNLTGYDSALVVARRIKTLRPDFKFLAGPRVTSVFIQADSTLGNSVDPNRHYEWRAWRAVRDAGGGWNGPGFLLKKGTSSYFSGFLNVNLALKDEFGRFVVVDSLYCVIKQLFIDPIDPVTGQPVYDGIHPDIDYASLTGVMTPSDSIDWVAAGYATVGEFLAAWEVASRSLHSRVRDALGDERIFATNTASGSHFDILNGAQNENLYALQGGTWYSNRDWTPGGLYNDSKRYAYTPRLKGMFPAASTNDSCADLGVVNVDTLAAIRQEQRFALGTACLADGAVTYGPSFASHARSGVFTGRSMANWWFDEWAVNPATGQAMTENITYQGWLGQPVGPPQAIIVTANGNTSATVNPGLETDGSGWTMTSFGDGSVARSNESAMTGSWAIKIVNNTARPLTPYWQRIRSLGGLLAAPGTATYVLSFDVMSQDGPTFFRAQMRDSVGGSTFGATSESNRVIWTHSVAGVWEHHEYPIFVTSSTGQLGLQMEFADTTHTGLFVDNVSVRQATVAGHNPMYKRQFTNGWTFVNPTASALTVTPGVNLRHISGYYDPIANPGGTVASFTVPAQDARFMLNELVAPGPDSSKQQRPKGGNTPRKRVRTR